ncbi:hypothetical protein JHK84_034721 [Glycine max]|uniref:Uncharacterized protein n=1 Tax=Glycine soja TaxID=3848 RepID=A0A445HSJ8_GLYSO|nr:hypothetical protein JHK87_034328 [Glycine soja]KAG5140953.1 hypothetical protein JHK84_034721 [Glycine max]KAH1143965.1 hypothetical protein GYH30_034269 [Glycine max]RZB76655.1 hypothetical protein D0Y65_034883 [Glycine soja]
MYTINLKSNALLISPHIQGVTKHKTYGADVINGLERQEHYQQIWKAISGNTKGPDARLAWWGVWISTIWNIWKLK